MNNFAIFDKSSLKAALEPFAPGMSDFITPIKYEAITPDIFAFLFRTTGKDNDQHFFVLLSYDYMGSFEEVKQTIHNWHASIIEFWQPQGREPDNFESEWAFVEYQMDKTYRTVLTRVEKPKGDGYWATNIILHLDGDVDEQLKDYTEKQRQAAKKSIERLLETKLKSRRVSLYFRDDGRTELFYN